MRILITGSRNWTNKPVIERAIRQEWMAAGHPKHVVIVHGAARGADYIADISAKRVGFFVEPHKADWPKYGVGAGPIRNQEMVDAGADVCLAFPLPDSKGTFDCIRRAQEAGIPVKIFEDL